MTSFFVVKGSTLPFRNENLYLGKQEFQEKKLWKSRSQFWWSELEDDGKYP